MKCTHSDRSEILFHLPLGHCGSFRSEWTYSRRPNASYLWGKSVASHIDTPHHDAGRESGVSEATVLLLCQVTDSSILNLLCRDRDSELGRSNTWRYTKRSSTRCSHDLLDRQRFAKLDGVSDGHQSE